MIDEEIITEGHSRYISLSERRLLKHALFNSIRGLDVLSELIEDEDITEIMVNGTNNIFVERSGKLERVPLVFPSTDKLGDIIQQIAAISNRRVNEASPIVDTRLADGSRVNIVLNPIAINGPVITIRKFPKEAMNMDRLISLGSISIEAAKILRILVEAGYNIFVSGGTGSGKTSFLNALSDFIPHDSRVITIEDSAELMITNIKNLVRLEVRQANTDGNGEISIRDLIRSALRMRPDRIIVGEVRGSEALDMLQAMNTGHDGSMSTGHANSPKDMLARLETMVLMGMDMPLMAIRSQIFSAIDIIVHLGRLSDKSRKVLEISQLSALVDNKITLEPLFSYSLKTGLLEPTNTSLIRTHKLSLSGLEGDFNGL